MQQLIKLLLLTILFGLLPSESIAQKSQHTTRTAGTVVEQRTAPVDDAALGRAFANKTSDIQVKGRGKVISLLADDVSGSRHQRFIVRLASGQTLLISHNIDIAPRIAGLKVGDTVRFYGEYVWNAKGGLIHWTHHDPQGRHVTGWVIHNGKTYK